jgi:hypothetical protein
MATVGGAGNLVACLLPRLSRLFFSAGLAAILVGNLHAQRAGVRGVPEPPRIGKSGALYDITGYWVSVVTEDWRHRMVTPPKGDYTGVMLTDAGRKLADTWDPAKDEASGEPCRGYGAPGIMRLPGRLHITWQDEQTLKLEADAGTQTRLLYFGTTDIAGGGWQGLSQASWEVLPGARGQSTVGSLKVVTTRMKPGYLRKNGVPYSTNAVLTEYFDRVTEPDGQAYLLISATLEDPAYLAQPFVTASHYRKQADSTGWNPTPCSAN